MKILIAKCLLKFPQNMKKKEMVLPKYEQKERDVFIPKYEQKMILQQKKWFVTLRTSVHSDVSLKGVRTSQGGEPINATNTF